MSAKMKMVYKHPLYWVDIEICEPPEYKTKKWIRSGFIKRVSGNSVSAQTFARNAFLRMFGGNSTYHIIKILGEAYER